MTKFIITESQYRRLFENSEEEEDLKYTHPVSGKGCKIKIARNNFTDRTWNQYSAVLVCDLYDDGYETIVATLPVTGNNPQEVKKIVCNNIEKLYQHLDDIMSDDYEIEINENENTNRWTLLNEPINCNL